MSQRSLIAGLAAFALAAAPALAQTPAPSPAPAPAPAPAPTAAPAPETAPAHHADVARHPSAYHMKHIGAAAARSGKAGSSDHMADELNAKVLSSINSGSPTKP